MLQRIQSVYFLLGAVLLSMLLWFNGSPGPAIEMRLAGGVEYAVAGAAALGCILALVVTFMYSNRKRQFTLATIPIVLSLVALVLFVGGIAVQSGINTNEWVLICAAAASLIMFILARRGISKDIKLIQSMDRIR